ncbi:alpha/beta fold hydrolase [Vagococcus silagei]|nr:alpha/beta hydrolase [Vagococcus silagei]
MPFVWSRTYSVSDLVRRVKGASQSIFALWEELLDVDFESQQFFDMPIYFFEGRHDHHVSSQLVEEYARTIKSKVSIIWYENSGHFPQWEEASKFNQDVTDIVEHLE